MGDRVLVKQFNDDAGAAFIEVIKKSGGPVRLQEIRSALVDAGVDAVDVDRDWRRVRNLLKFHPHIAKPKPALYEWSPAAQPSSTSLQKLAERAGVRGHRWLIQSWIDNIADSLARAETAGPRAQIGWTEQREQEKATVLAGIVSSAEAFAAEGQTGVQIVDRLLEEAARHRLTPIGRIGERIEFDKSRHEPAGRGQPRAGGEVRVVRSGFEWSGSGHPIVVVKALVE
ncbi:hypothetical protein Dvina_47435 [Dactylosporangium vinaceum]|uniref:Uncharacterized protein n=1 Tax=Dactylosporangium vinaceum TaxID=53362 RepID=A0ABV5M5L3_9ACTN|nr:hypothetical protein [Dactylosporangium vinaceum]UAB95563.1 hypothetical protein Dvina_47435 [Dactylosporangium vinaceum]